MSNQSIDFDYYCHLEVEKISFVDKGHCRGNVQILLNGLRLSLGVMQGTNGKGDWVAWPTRQAKSGKPYPIVWPANEEVRQTVEQTVLRAFAKKQLETLVHTKFVAAE